MQDWFYINSYINIRVFDGLFSSGRLFTLSKTYKTELSILLILTIKSPLKAIYIHFFTISPDSGEVIEATIFLVKNVDDHISVIH